MVYVPLLCCLHTSSRIFLGHVVHKSSHRNKNDHPNAANFVVLAIADNLLSEQCSLYLHPCILVEHPSTFPGAPFDGQWLSQWCLNCQIPEA